LHFQHISFELFSTPVLKNCGAKKGEFFQSAKYSEKYFAFFFDVAIGR
jgi:hypothetical protein